MVAISNARQLGCRRPFASISRFATKLLGGVATGALLAGGVALAEEFSDGETLVTAGDELSLDTLDITGGTLGIDGSGDLPAGVVRVSGDGTMSAGLITGDGNLDIDGSFTQSGGTVGGGVFIHAPNYVQTGGIVGDYVTINADTFELGGTNAQTFANIYATELFRLDPDGDVVFGATLHGAAGLIKAGASTVTMTQMGSNFTGDIKVEGGTLEYTEGFESRTGNLDVADGATFRSAGGDDTRFAGSMTGDGTFEKRGTNFFGIGGTGDPDAEQPIIDMGGLDVTEGYFVVGTKYFLSDSDPDFGDSIDAHFGYVHLGAAVPEDAEDDYRELGDIMVERGSTLRADTFDMTSGRLWSRWDDNLAQQYPDGLPQGKLVAESFSQSGGLVDKGITIATTDYLLSGGDTRADVEFSGVYRLTGGAVMDGNIVGIGDEAAIEQSGGLFWAWSADNIATYTLSAGDMQTALSGLKKFTQSGTGRITQGDNPVSVQTEVYELLSGDASGFGDVEISKELILSGGNLTREGLTVPTFTQTGGTYTGNLTVDTYDFSGGGFNGWIAANTAINVSAAAGATATATAELRGDAKLTKTGDGIVVLSNQSNAFTGDVSIEAGVLDVLDNALPQAAAVDIAAGGTLQFTIGDDLETVFVGKMTGTSGSLVKTGEGTLVLTNDIELGDLAVNAGLLKIGDGTSTETASFDSAIIAADAALYIARNATLEIRVPNHLTNYGTLVNDGTVIDDLDNTGDFKNNGDYDADVSSNTGRIANNQPGVWTGDIVTNDGEIYNYTGATWNGAVKSNTRRIFNNGTWLNGTVESNGPSSDGLWTSEIANEGVWHGDVLSNTMRITQAAGTWYGDVKSNNGLIINDNRGHQEIGIGYWYGSLDKNAGEVFNAGGGDWNGDVIANLAGGRILNDGSADHGLTWYGAWRGDVQANAGTIDNLGRWFGDVVTNTGSIYNNGSWTGDVLSNTGSLRTLSTWTGNVASTGTLTAGGTITGALSNNGTLDLIGNLAVGSVSLGANSLVKADINLGGINERLTSTGAAQLDGIIRVKAGVVQAGGDYLKPYTVVEAGSIAGVFDGVTTDLAFLAPTLRYTGTTAIVDFSRNEQPFMAVGITENQKGVAAELELLGPGNKIYDAILGLTAEGAQDAFDQLSGEIYASAGAAAASNAPMVLDLVFSHLGSSFGKVQSGGSASGYAADPLLAADGSPENGAWMQAYGAYGAAAGKSGSSGINGVTGGMAIGADTLRGPVRVGVVVDGGASRTEAAALNSTIDSIDYGGGIYGGGDFGGTQFRLAGTYTRHNNNANRRVDFPGFSETLTAQYAAATWQVGGEVSHELDLGAFSITPFAGASYANHQTDGFSEKGGAAALTYKASSATQTTTTVGATLGYQTALGDGVLMTTTATVGWRHNFAGAASASMQLVGGGPVTVVGTSSSGDLLALGAAMNLDLSDSTSVDFVYDGKLGLTSQTHAVTGTWTTHF